MKKITKKTLSKTAVILLIIASLLFGCCACSKDTSTTTGNVTAQSDTSETVAQSNTSKSEIAILAEQVKVGDYVNYNAASGDGAGKSYTYTYKYDYTRTSKTVTFNSSDEMKWIVMSVDKDAGTVELMAENPTTEKMLLDSQSGIKSAIKALNDIGALYGCGEGATGGRSITIEDVNTLENYTPKISDEESSYTFTYTSGTFLKEDGTEVTATEDKPVTMRYTDTNHNYTYYTKNFTDKTFWLASYFNEYYAEDSCYYVRRIAGGFVGCIRLCFSSGDDVVQDDYYLAGVMPVVTLKANIKTSGQDENGAWNLIIE